MLLRYMHHRRLELFKKTKKQKAKLTTFTHCLVQSALPLTVRKRAGLSGSPELVVVHMSRLDYC